MNEWIWLIENESVSGDADHRRRNHNEYAGRHMWNGKRWRNIWLTNIHTKHTSNANERLQDLFIYVCNSQTTHVRLVPDSLNSMEYFEAPYCQTHICWCITRGNTISIRQKNWMNIVLFIFITAGAYLIVEHLPPQKFMYRTCIKWSRKQSKCIVSQTKNVWLMVHRSKACSSHLLSSLCPL